MCGIIGVTGRPSAVDDILAGLRRLEYRGYDSSGVVAVLDGPLSRDAALRAPWIISGVVHIGLLLVVLRRLSTAALDSIRSPEAEA